jgi:hypothetical protein
VNVRTTLRPASKVAQHHPQRALWITMLALRHRKALLAVKNATDHVSRSTATARRVAGNRKVQRETRLALSSMALAKERVLKVGFGRATRDKRLAAHLHQARHHASKAMVFAGRARRKRRFEPRTTTVVAVTGAGALGGAAYAGWKVYGRPQTPVTASHASETAQPSARDAPASAS